MKYLQPSFLLLALAATSLAQQFTYTVTGTHKGKPIKSSDIVIEPKEPSLYRLNHTADPGRSKPKDKGRKVKRTNGTWLSSNWCGVVQHSPSTNKITSIHGYFQVPTLSQRPGVSSYPQYVATWVGVDGVTWSSALFQSGITSQLSSSGAQTNWAWIEWVPNGAFNIPSFPVSTGDWIELTVSILSSTSGTITINNLDQQTTYSATFTNGQALGQVDGEWIVEDPSTSGGLVPFARFSDTWFESTIIYTTNGTTKGVDGATMFVIPNNVCTPNEYDNDDFWAASG